MCAERRYSLDLAEARNGTARIRLVGFRLADLTTGGAREEAAHNSKQAKPVSRRQHFT